MAVRHRSPHRNFQVPVIHGARKPAGSASDVQHSLPVDVAKGSDQELGMGQPPGLDPGGSRGCLSLESRKDLFSQGGSQMGWAPPARKRR